jgi:hypothetical protein
MAIARAKLVDVSVARWYHRVSRCVRQAFLLGERDDNQREWLENRLEELADIYAVAVGGFSMMENHLHVLLRLDPEVAQAWSDSVYIDLNPVAAKATATPETSDNTSIKQRVDHAEAQSKTAELEAAKDGSVAGSQAAAGLEESLWLCPIEDRRGLDSSREGMIQGFPLGSYVKLVEYTGRLYRQGKASILAELAGIFEQQGWNDTQIRFFNRGSNMHRLWNSDMIEWNTRSEDVWLAELAEPDTPEARSGDERTSDSVDTRLVVQLNFVSSTSVRLMNTIAPTPSDGRNDMFVRIPGSLPL